MNCQDYRHPLLHNGTNQQSRLSPSLLPESVKLDKRTVADILKFTHELAALFKYFNLDNEEAGNWQCFFEKEQAAILAIIVATDLDAYDIAYIEDEAKFWKDDAEAQTEQEKRAKRDENYRTFIRHIYNLALQIQELCQSIPDGMALKAEVLDIIRQQVGRAIFDNRVQNVLEQLIAYDKGSGAAPGPEKYKAFIIGEKGVNDCTRAWGLYSRQAGPSWQDSFFCITPDDGFKEEQPPDDCKENRNLRSLFIIYLQALATIIVRAKVHLRRELALNRAHQPHLSLFLAFIFVFKYLQRQYNRLPQRHLDYYYAEVLQLMPLGFQPDQAHVVFELAKNFEDFLLRPGTLLEAIKDSNGNPIRYFANHELVLNQAKVEALKTNYLQTVESGYQIFAAPVADSADSQGAAFASEAETRWRPLGDIEAGVPAELGFAIASPEFTLREGERYLYLTLRFENAAQVALLKSAIEKIAISTPDEESGWHEIDKQVDPSDIDPNTPENSDTSFSLELQINSQELKCTILLKPDAPGFDLPTDKPDPFFKNARYPILKFLFCNAASAIDFDQLRKLSLIRYEENGDFKSSIKVQVRGIRNLSFLTNSGVFDNTAAFPAFGQKTGATIIGPLKIGNDEVFRKKLTGLNIYFEDIENAIVNTTDAVEEFILREKNLLPLRETDVEIDLIKVDTTNDIKDIPYGANPNILFKIVNAEPTFDSRVAHQDLPPYQEADDGFLEIRPAIDLNNAAQVILPKFQNFFINYTAEQDAGFEEKEQFFHILPFGFNEIKNTIAENIPTEERAPIALIPPFQPPLPASAGQDLIAGGNLFIGIKNLIPGQGLSLLFQILAGSGDPNYEPPAIQWSYLKENEETGIGFAWQEFSPENIVRDSTRINPDSEKSLLRPGIVQFNTSADMVKTGTIVDPAAELHWIRASAVENIATGEQAAALPDLVAVLAQAALCTFINNGNSLEHLETVMPKQSISKLSERKTAVKNVKQPFASFGGKNVEVPNAFYRRVSERLRHKNRAVSLWDYERLVLEAFPDIRHVKCITHTSVGCEIDPGHVLVAVFPDLRNRNVFNRTEPGLGPGELEAVEEYLRRRANLFVFCDGRIQAVNPLYELLQVECCVKFRDGFLPKKYADILEKDIRRFLAPWAFDEEAPIFFSGAFHRSTILNYIEKRPYVDKVFDFAVFHYIKDPKTGKPVSQHLKQDGKKAPVPRETILSASARSIFTTFTSENPEEPDHNIRIWGEEGCEACLKPEEFTRFDICSET